MQIGKEKKRFAATIIFLPQHFLESLSSSHECVLFFMTQNFIHNDLINLLLVEEEAVCDELVFDNFDFHHHLAAEFNLDWICLEF